MGCYFNLLVVLLTLLALLVPVGLVLAVVKRKSGKGLTLGIVLMLLGIPPCFIMVPFYLWQFDAHRGWELRLSADAPPYTVTLVQKPGGDFYDSLFEITRPDGKVAKVLIDSDDFRWWNPAVVRKDGKIYFVCGAGKIDDHTSYVEPEKGIIYSGYYQRTYKIPELEFKEPQSD